MQRFAKLFESEKYGQILVKVDADDECHPEVRFYCIPGDLGVCSLAITFEDSDGGWEEADKSFKQIDIEKAEKMVSTIFSITEEGDDE